MDSSGKHHHHGHGFKSHFNQCEPHRHGGGTTGGIVSSAEEDEKDEMEDDDEDDMIGDDKKLLEDVKITQEDIVIVASFKLPISVVKDQATGAWKVT